MKFVVCWRIYENEQHTLVISSLLGYGHCDNGKDIPGGATFVLDVESIIVKRRNNDL